MLDANQAREALASLQAEKADLQALKQQILSQLAEVRLRHAQTRAGRIPLPRGGGMFGRVARLGVQSKRRGERLAMQKEVDFYAQRKLAVDRSLQEVNAAIASLRGTLRTQATMRSQTTLERARPRAPARNSPEDVARRLEAPYEMSAQGLIGDREYKEKREELLKRL